MLRTTVVLALLLALLVPLVGCGDLKENAEKIGAGLGKAWKAAAAWTVEKKDQAVSFFGDRLSGLKDDYEAARAKAAELGGDAAQALQAKWGDLQVKMEAMKEATGEQWVKARDAFVAAYEAFHREVKSSE